MIDEINSLQHKLSSFSPFEGAAAGHAGTLKDNSGEFFAKATTQQEVDFYLELFQQQTKDLHGESPEKSEDEDEDEADAASIDIDIDGSRLWHWVAPFYGTLENTINTPESDEKPYIVLKNLTNGFVHPSVLDIKLGKILWDSNATPEKVERLKKVSDSTTSGSLYFRICGMKVYDHEKKDYIVYDKFFGRNLTTTDVADGILKYFEPLGSNDYIEELLVVYIERLELLLKCLQKEEVRLIASSLLFTYESDLKRWEDATYHRIVINHLDDLFNEDLEESEEEEDETKHEDVDKEIKERDQKDNEADELDQEGDDSDELDKEAPISTLSFIDFAHSQFTPGQGPDENVTSGLKNLLETFEKCLKKVQT